jgi:hypothetical protein
MLDESGDDLFEDDDDAVDAELESALVELFGRISFKYLREFLSLKFKVFLLDS